MGDVSAETLADTNKLLDSITGLNEQAAKATDLQRMTDELQRTEEALDSAQKAAYQLTLQLAATDKPSRELTQAQKAARTEVERLEKAYASQWSALLKADGALQATGADTRDLAALQAQLRNEIGRTAVAIERQAQSVRAESTAVGELKQRMADGDAAFRKQAESSRAAGESLRQYRERAAAAERGTRELASASQTGSRFMARFAAVVGGLTSFFSVQGAWNATKQMLGLGDAAEQTRKRLNRLYGEGAGDQAFDTIQQLARGASLQFDSLLQSALKLKSFGLEPLDGTLQGLVDQNALLGGSMESLDGLILAVGQAWSKQNLQGEEILQLVERGVPVWDLLAQATGKNVTELQRLSSAGELGRDVIKQLLDEMARSADGAAAENINTLSGLWRGFVDDVQGFARDVANSGALDWFKAQLSEIRDTIARMSADGALAQWAQRVSDAVISVANSLKTGTQFLYEHRGALLLAAKAYAAFKIGQALVQMNQWRISLWNATNELVRTNTAINAAGKSALSFGALLRGLPASIAIGVALVGIEQAYKAGERLGTWLARYSEGTARLREVEAQIEKQWLASARAASEAAKGLEANAHQQVLSAEAAARLGEEERASYAARVGGLRDYLVELDRYYQAMQRAGALTPDLAKQWEGVKARLEEVRQGISALEQASRTAGDALKNGIGVGAQAVADGLRGIDSDAKAARESIKKVFEGLNFADSNKLGDVGVALAQIAAGGAVADRNVREGLLETLRTLSGEELLRFQTASQAAFDVWQIGPAQAAAVLEATLVAAMERLNVAAERMGTQFTQSGRDATAAFSAILENANATSQQIETAFRAALSKVATVDEVRVLGDLLRSAGEQGAIGFDQTARAMQLVDARIRSITAAVDPLVDEFALLGIQSQASLNAAKDAAYDAFDAIRRGAASGKASVEDVRRAFEAYARTARATVADSDAAARDRVDSELAVMDAVINSGRALERLAEQGGAAGEAVSAGASAAAGALDNVAASAGAASDAVQAVGAGAAGATGQLAQGAQAAQGMAFSIGQVGEAFWDTWRQMSRAMQPGSNPIAALAQMLKTLNRERRELRDYATELDKTAQSFDALAQRREELQRKFSFVGKDEIEAILQKEQAIKSAREAQAQAYQQEQDQQRQRDEARLKTAQGLQQAAEQAAGRSDTVKSGDEAIRIEFITPTNTQVTNLQKILNELADVVVKLATPKIIQAISRARASSNRGSR
ncbi:MULTISPECIES: tape measure protein [unclassified Pseudoxanthomonas]|uniref:tape measure protein n=1 Tax=unclassified Pseudoxanthomonas TaxID=2645906 RepID=UPI00307DB9D8